MTSLRGLAVVTTTEVDLERAEPTLSSLNGQGCHVVLVLREARINGARSVQGDVCTVRSPRSHSLAAARNVGLAAAVREGLLPAAPVVFFPDDDNVPPPDLLASVERAMREHEDAVGVVGTFGPSLSEVDWDRFMQRPGNVTRRLAEQLVSSNTLYLRGATVEVVGGFDEHFGLGARFGSAEDMDYALRAMRHGSLYYDPRIFTKHPYKSRLFSRNFPGNVAVKVANRDLVGAARLLAHGARRVRAGDLEFRHVARALRYGLAAARGRDGDVRSLLSL